MKVDEYTKTMDYLTKTEKEPIVYLLQEVPGTKIGVPKYNIIGAQKFGKIKVLLIIACHKTIFLSIWSGK